MTDDAMPVRLSHLLRHCSVGAIVRGPDHLVTVKDTSFWKSAEEREIRHVDRVRRALGIGKSLRPPPKARVEDKGRVTGQSVPALRFPGWTRCSRCGLLHHRPWRRAKSSGDTASPGDVQIDPFWCLGPGEGRRTGQEAQVCGGKLEQTPWVLAHERGYLAEVPWHAVAHSNSKRPDQRACSADWASPYLRVRPARRGYEVICTRCRASGAVRRRFPYSVHERQQPWLPKPPPSAPGALAWILEINDVRVHSPETRTALVIPPESRIRKGTVVDRLYSSTKKWKEIRDARPGLQRRTVLRRIAGEWRCGVDEVAEAIGAINRGYPLYGETIGDGELLPSEYRALIKEIPDLEEDEDFVTEHHTADWFELGRNLKGAARLSAVVDRLIAVNRLKEIMVLDGFRRLEGRMTPPDLTGESDWLPALELYGEGIFFTLRESLLQPWEADEKVRDRARIFRDRFGGTDVRSQMGPAQVSPRFLLLHTLAHLMIRELETRAGYPAASLKERIYCETDRDTGPGSMAGILIYVAVPDTEGSLGGLMGQAEPRLFLRLLSAAVEAAAWCSLDPVCARQEGHGPGLLNRAACHACTLLPETSCAFGNVLLDRSFVTDIAGGIPGLFDAAGHGFRWS